MKTNRVTGNKGEWSEMYAFLKILGDKRIYGADSELNVRKDIHYDINKVIREETKGEAIEYVVNKDMNSIDVISNGVLKAQFKIHTYVEEAEYLFGEICSCEGTFSVDRTVEFMEKICCKKLKASSREKKDIVVEVHDFRTGMDPVLGFSIKSNIGGNSTLLNASGSTNFIFEIVGATDEDMIAINSFTKVKNSKDGMKEYADLKSKIEYVVEKGLELRYVDTQNDAFKANMIIIDSQFPIIISEMLKDFYINGTSSLEKQVDNLTERNPLDYSMGDLKITYRYKVKKFLLEIATGMMPGTHWSGREDATGGYFIVKEDGEIVCYHLYNRDDFEEYLLKSTYMDKPGTKRHDYGKIEKKDDGKYYLKLNLQIRFNKKRDVQSGHTIDTRRQT